MNKEIKSYGFEYKMIDDFTFEGYASVFGNVDGHKDVMEPGAFTKTLQEGTRRVKVLYQHNPLMPIGKPIAMSEDSKGLHVKAKISQTDEGTRAMILMKDKVIDELSIGYNTIKDAWDKPTGTRRLKEVRLWEFSPVTYASNELAQITAAKNLEGMESLAYLLGDLKAGRMLSANNTDLVKKAVEALTALLNASEGKGEPSDDTHQPEGSDDGAAEEIKSMVDFMRKNFDFTKGW